MYQHQYINIQYNIFFTMCNTVLNFPTTISNLYFYQLITFKFIFKLVVQGLLLFCIHLEKHGMRSVAI